jgi:heme exporter protein D
MKLDSSELRYVIELQEQLKRRRASRAVMLWLGLPAGVLVTIGVIGQYLPAEAAMYVWLALTMAVVVVSGSASGPLARDRQLSSLLERVVDDDPANREEKERLQRMLAGRSRLEDILNRSAR